MVEVLTILLGVIFGVIMLLGTLVGMSDNEHRRRNWKAGTHDYYGNKITKSSKEDDS